jgi:hypothetical protein
MTDGHEPAPPEGASLASPKETVVGVGVPDPRPPGAIAEAWPTRKEPERRPVDPAEIEWWKAHAIPAG